MVEEPLTSEEVAEVVLAIHVVEIAPVRLLEAVARLGYDHDEVVYPVELICAEA